MIGCYEFGLDFPEADCMLALEPFSTWALPEQPNFDPNQVKSVEELEPGMWVEVVNTSGSTAFHAIGYVVGMGLRYSDHEGFVEDPKSWVLYEKGTLRSASMADDGLQHYQPNGGWNPRYYVRFFDGESAQPRFQPRTLAFPPELWTR